MDISKVLTRRQRVLGNSLKVIAFLPKPTKGNSKTNENRHSQHSCAQLLAASRAISRHSATVAT